LSPGEAHDAPVGRQLLLELGPLPVEVPLLMDRAYEGDETRQLVLEMNMIPVVPPKSNRREPLGLRSRTLQETEPDRAPVSTPERLPPHFFALRETRRCVSGLYLLCLHHRGPAIV
jgi:hypothetical protein